MEIDELRQAFDQAIRSSNKRSRIPARLGIQSGSGWLIDVPGLPNFVYVRVGTLGSEESVTVHKALNLSTGKVPNLPIWLEYNTEGILTVTGVRETEFIEFSEGELTGAAVGMHTHEPGKGMVDPVSVRRLVPGLVYATGNGLEVGVRPFSYRYAGTDKYFSGGTIALGSYLPDNGLWNWIKICLNPASNSLVALAGSAKSVFVELTSDELDSINAYGLISLAGVKLRFDASELNEKLIEDRRPFWSVVNPGISGLNVWLPDQEPVHPDALNDEFSGSTLQSKWSEYDPGNVQNYAISSGVLQLSQTAQSNAKLSGIYQTLPSGDFTAVAKIKIDKHAANLNEWWRAGIALFEDASNQTDKIILAGLAVLNEENSNRITFGWSLFQGFDTIVGSTDIKETNLWNSDEFIYIRTRKDGNNFHFDYSKDGFNWRTQDTTEIDFTPTHIGVGLAQIDDQSIQVSVNFFRFRSVFDAVTEPVYGSLLLSSNSIGDLGDVNLATLPEDKQVLVYDENSAEWVPGNAIKSDVSGQINELTEKALPAANDVLLIEDSAANYIKKKIRINNLPNSGGGGSLPNIGARVYHNSNQTVLNETSYFVQFNSERWDTDNIHDLSTNNTRLTCRTSGVYIISAHIRWAINNNGFRSIELRVNGNTIIASLRSLPVSNQNLEQTITTIYSLNENDYVEVRLWQNSGASLDVLSVNNYSPEFAMQLIAPV